MSISTNNDEESLSSDIFGNNEYKPESPAKKKFLPWHKPRKHFVRQHQWTSQIDSLVKSMLFESKELRYLGLPGEDLLDLRFFHEKICIPNNIYLKFLGFNNGTPSTALNISLDEVKKLTLVDASSQVIEDDICQIANTASIAWQHSFKMGPYDVVNIDLCNGFGKHPINEEFKLTHYMMLNQLLALQSKAKNPWLLLLTTRTGEQHVNSDVFDLLKTVYQQNLEKCQTFQDLSKDTLLIEDDSSLEIMLSDAKVMADVFLIALCKWISGLCVGYVPPLQVEVTDVMGYVVNRSETHKDMVSIAIKITPTFTPPSDHMGLANQTIHNIIDECTTALQALNKITNLLDVDSHLEKNDDVMKEMVSTSSALLEEARYDVTSYTEWARAIVK